MKSFQLQTWECTKNWKRKTSRATWQLHLRAYRLVSVWRFTPWGRWGLPSRCEVSILASTMMGSGLGMQLWLRQWNNKTAAACPGDRRDRGTGGRTARNMGPSPDFAARGTIRTWCHRSWARETPRGHSTIWKIGGDDPSN
jgi:hypothetical protein